MRRCAVCTRDVPTTPFLVGPNPGRPIGNVCGEECGRLLWDVYFERLEILGIPTADKDTRDLTHWRIRRRAVEANALVFREEPPKSSVELVHGREIELLGLTGIDGELA